VTLRNRTLAGAAVLVLAPLLVLAVAIRREMASRLTDQYTGRVDALIAVIEADLSGRGRDLRSRLTALEATLREDDSFRLAVEGREELRTYLLDSAGRVMELMGLDLLQIQDKEGRILSSGHFRNEYDRVDVAVIDWLAAIPEEIGLLPARRARGPFFALARLDSLVLGKRTLYVVGGWEVNRRSLAALSPHPDLVVSLVYPGGVLSSKPEHESRLGPARDPRQHLARLRRDEAHLVRARPVATLPAPGTSASTAWLVVSHSLEPMRTILRALDRRLLLAWGIVAAGSIALAVRLSGRIAAPIEDLARTTSSLDLDRLDAKFPTDRPDEVGTLARFLAEMTARLRSSVMRLREAERKAAFGEIARQVNHDLRNGFTPIRNVVRHLSQIAHQAPAELAGVFRERESTLDSGLSYLEELATNYARLSSSSKRVACDLAEIVRQVAGGRLAVEGGPVHVSFEPDLPAVLADPVGVRRIVENLLSNSCEALRSGTGRVDVTGRRGELAGEPAVRLEVTDDGEGIPAGELERIFDHFYTTKDTGTGLGLSIVKRLVSDFEGSIRVESEPGQGTKFTVTLPAAPPETQEPRA
jgi:signal transduction histidine kinase